MEIESFLKSVQAVRSSDAFNPYVDAAEYDLPKGPEIRLRNLRKVLSAALTGGIHHLWLGRDLGYLGGRRTGIALTDERNLHACALRFGVSLEKATGGHPVRESTAGYVWAMLPQIAQPIFPWNVFPLHPHKAGEPDTNRSHSSAERRMGLEILSQLIELLRPAEIVCLGQDASRIAIKFGLPIHGIRHPSHGGATDFRASVAALYQLPTTGSQSEFRF